MSFVVRDKTTGLFFRKMRWKHSWGPLEQATIYATKSGARQSGGWDAYREKWNTQNAENCGLCKLGQPIGYGPWSQFHAPEYGAHWIYIKTPPELVRTEVVEVGVTER